MRYFTLQGTSEQSEAFIKKVGMPLDDIFEKAEFILGASPQPLRNINVILCDDAVQVQVIYKERYKKPFDGIAFISLGRMDIVISIEDASLRVFAHEVGHAIVEQYFTPRPAYGVHELLAQY